MANNNLVVVGAEGELGDELARQVRTSARDRGAVYSGVLGDALGFQPLRASLEWHAFYAGLLERACEDAATSVRTQLLHWKVGNKFKTNSELLLDFMLAFLLESPGAQKVAVELIGRTLSLMRSTLRELRRSRKELARRAAAASELSRRADETGEALMRRQRGGQETVDRATIINRELAEAERVAEQVVVSPTDRTAIADTFEQIAAEKRILEDVPRDAPEQLVAVNLRIDELIQDLSDRLGIPADDIHDVMNGGRNVQKVVDIVEGIRREPLKLEELRRQASEALSQAGVGVEAFRDVEALSAEAVLGILSTTNDEKRAQAKMVITFLEAVEDGAKDGSELIAKLVAEGVATEKGIKGANIDGGGKAVDVAFPMLETALQVFREQLSGYQEHLLELKLTVNFCIELRSTMEFRKFADDTLRKIAKNANGFADTDAPIEVDGATLPLRSLSAGLYRRLAAHEIEFLFWALTLAPMIFGGRHIFDQEHSGGMLRFSGLPDEAIEYLRKRFAEKVPRDLGSERRQGGGLKGLPAPNQQLPGAEPIDFLPYNLQTNAKLNPAFPVYVMLMRCDYAWRERARAEGKRIPELPYERAFRTGRH